MTNPYADEYQKFLKNIEGHKLEIVKSKGLYRHLRVKGDWGYSVLTWPGHVVFQNGTTYAWSRTEDMLDWLRLKDLSYLDIHYMAEKLTTDRDSVKKFEIESFKKLVQEHVDSALDPEWGYVSDKVAEEFRAAVQEDIFDSYNCEDESDAYRALDEFEFKWAKPHGPTDHWGNPEKTETFRFEDPWEWFSSSREYRWDFVWACHAIVWAAQQYDAVKGVPGQTTNVGGKGWVDLSI